MARPGDAGVITFEGLSPEAAEKLASGWAAAAGTSLREVLQRATELKSMHPQEVENIAKIVAAMPGNGQCGVGCC